MKKFLVPLAIAAIALSGCGASAADKAAQSQNASVPASGGNYPVDVVSCGQSLHFDAPPKKVLVLGATSASNLDALGLFDKLSLRAGKAHFDAAAPDLQTKHDALPAVDAGKTDTGGVTVATEVVLKEGVDLVIGYDKGVEREQLAKAGVRLYSPEAYCPKYEVTKASWSDIDGEMTRLATIFGVPDKAKTVIDDLHAKTDKLRQAASTDRGSAVAIYMSAAATKLRVYGTSSMIQPIFEANGLKNAYDDNTTRVFDGTMEDLLAKNPEWIVLLSSDQTEEETLKAFKAFSGADKLQAVAKNQVVVIPFVLTDPPNALSVKGAEALAEKLAKR